MSASDFLNDASLVLVYVSLKTRRQSVSFR